MKPWHLLLATAALGAAGFGYQRYWQRPASVPAAVAAPRPSASVDPNLLVDPLAPQHPATLDRARSLAENWHKARPGFQASRKPAERGGVEPCATQKVDLSAFAEPLPLSKGRLTLPRELVLATGGRFDLVMHLNGDEPVRRELALSGAKLALYTLTIDPSQGYAPLFTGTGLFAALLGEIERAASKQAGREARVGRIALSAWSAGFVGITAILSQPQTRDRADAVILIDGLHAPRGDRPAFEAQLAPFVAFAARASESQRFFLVSHSSIDPPGFASTSECAHYLIAAQGGEPSLVRRADPYGLELVESYTRGEFHVRGYAGNDKADHCAQLAVLRGAFAALARRWATPAR
jgi:hypothetical protein